MIAHPYLGGVIFPFVCSHQTFVRIAGGARFHLGGRIFVGNSDFPRISLLPTNIQIGKGATVEVGHSVSIGPGVNLIIKENAKLIIGHSTYFAADMHLEAVSWIEIGASCAISWGVTMIDSDHHDINYHGRDIPTESRIVIGDHVWVGCNCTLLRGTVVGEHCVIAAGSVVKGSFPARVLIGGNPARILREHVTWS